MDRLGWILDGLDGQEGWGSDAADVLAPEFTATRPAHRLVGLTRQRAAAHAPVTVVGIDITGRTARARIRNNDGSTDVVSCTVESGPPHRITETWLAGFVPAGLTPRLPMDFADYPLPRMGDGDGKGGSAQLVVFSGLPGSGKSTLAEAAGRRLRIPVFAIDWLLGSLTPVGGQHLDGLWDAGSELLTTLALRQLVLGQSTILDCPVEEPATRARWRSLAQRAGADFKVVVCVCADPGVHRTRLEGRKRGIPGWHDAGNWADVQRRLADFPPWTGEVLTIDTTQPHESSLAAVLDYLSR
jgi:predicted kinase